MGWVCCLATLMPTTNSPVWLGPSSRTRTPAFRPSSLQVLASYGSKDFSQLSPRSAITLETEMKVTWPPKQDFRWAGQLACLWRTNCKTLWKSYSVLSLLTRRALTCMKPAWQLLLPQYIPCEWSEIVPHWSWTWPWLEAIFSPT